MEQQETDNRGVSESATEEQDQVFDAAFTEAEGIGPSDDQAPPQETPEQPEGKSPANENQGTTPKPEGEIQGEPAATPVPANDDTAEQRYRTLQGIHKKDKETWEQKEREYQEKINSFEKAPGRSSDAKPVSTDVDSSDLSDEDKAALKEYDEEFDTISKMEGLKRKVELSQFKKEVMDVISQLTQSIMPAVNVSAEVAQAKHFDAIREAHADFEVHRDNGSIKKWIDTKPEYLRDAYQKAYSKGSPEEVIDLITTFKNENNIPGSNPGALPTNSSTNARTQSKKAALAAVTNRRGAVNLMHQPADDFDGAFEEATHKIGG